ncbi:hypothetical protein GW17_00015800 [Ensete ventricosum]|nr:hypothetical protein GW17_00015800 [Ensete ventricosum]
MTLETWMAQVGNESAFSGSWRAAKAKTGASIGSACADAAMARDAVPHATKAAATAAVGKLRRTSRLVGGDAAEEAEEEPPRGAGISDDDHGEEEEEEGGLWYAIDMAVGIAAPV